MFRKILTTVFVLFFLFSGINIYLNTAFLQTQYRVSITKIRNALMNSHKKSRKTVVDSVFSQLSYLQRNVAQGQMSLGRAKQIAIDMLRSYVSSEGDYVWVNDIKGNLIVHPANDLVGKNVLNYKTPKGKFIFREVIDLVNKSGAGYISYHGFRRSEQLSENTEVKLSYVNLYKPWGWVVGTGVYISDVKAEERAMEKELITVIRASITRNLIILIVILVLASILIITQIKWILKPLKNLMEAITKMESGDLTARAEVSTKDEIGELGQTFNAMAGTIKDYTDNLEQKVEKRTQELKEAFENIKALKDQQDGDYYLTSLLLNPLLMNEVKSNIIDVEFYLDQKEKFKFMTKTGEIGGDISIANMINLRSKQYMVYINGDAMGKSLQGAGGALVMGVVFNAYLNQTKGMSHAQSVSPEKWLIDCYDQLRRVFDSFNGRMLISAVIGLVDLETGLMYYVNLGHPWPIVYKDGKAEYIGEDNVNQKLGMMEGTDSIKIRMHKLTADEVVIIGSDGKDDLAVGIHEETGMKIINEDERKFLDIVEKSNSDIEKLIEEISKTGELTDDISLIKIMLKKNVINTDIPHEFYSLRDKAELALKEERYVDAVDGFESALKIHKDEKCFDNLCYCHKTMNNFEDEAKCLERALWFYPEKIDYMYRASLIFKRLYRFDKAAYYGERFRLHHPEHVNNLVSLADIYRLKEEFDVAHVILEEAEGIDKDNASIVKLKELIQTDMSTSPYASM